MVTLSTQGYWLSGKGSKKSNQLVEGFYKVPYEQRLKRLKLTTLEKRRQRGDLIEAYKILTSKEWVDSNCFFMLDKKHYSTRGHELKLYTRRSRLELRIKLIQPTGGHTWRIGTSYRSQSSRLRLWTRSRTGSIGVTSGAFKASCFYSPTSTNCNK